MNPKTLNRYLKVRALAEAGSPGEKEAAQRTLGKMEARYPGVKEEADKLHQERQAGQKATRPPAHPPHEGRTGNWEQIFRYAAGFYSTVRDVVEEVAEAYYGKILAEQEVVVSATRNKSHLFIRVKVPVEAAQEARSMNAAQKSAFREVVMEEVEGYLDALLDE